VYGYFAAPSTNSTDSHIIIQDRVVYKLDAIRTT